MVIFFNTFNLCLIGIVCLLMKRRGFDPLLFLSLLCLVFFALPMWQSYNLNEVGELARNYNVSSMLISIFDIFLIQLLIFWVFLVSIFIKPKSIWVRCNFKARTTGATAFDVILIAVWLIVFYQVIRWWGGINFGLLIFARKYFDLPQLYIILLTLVPTVLYFRAYIYQSPKIYIVICAILLIISTIITGQRRELLTAFLLVTLLPAAIKNNKFGACRRDKQVTSRAIWVGLAAVCLIPLSWYARGVSTQFNRSGELNLTAFEARGFLELIGGSMSSGYQSFLIFSHHIDNNIIKFGDGLLFLATSVLPRSIFQEKFLSVPQIIRSSRGDAGNVSSFFLNDMYFSHPVAAFVLVPVVLYGIHLIARQNIWAGVLTFCYIPYIYKNGIFQFFPIFFVLTVLLVVGSFFGRFDERKSNSYSSFSQR